jgi:hypothetical protein
VAAASPVLLVTFLAWRGGLGRGAGLVLLSLYATYVTASVAVALS